MNETPRLRRTRKDKPAPAAPTNAPQAPLSPEGEKAGAAPLEITWADNLRAHAIVQVISGQHRGWLGIIGAIHGSTIKLYSILPLQRALAHVDVQASEVAVIGQAKVASRNPFPEIQSPVAGEDPESSFE